MSRKSPSGFRPQRLKKQEDHPDHDFYPTHPDSTNAFLDEIEKDGFRFQVPIWEPMCGDGKGIVTPLRKRGYKVIASDIMDRGCPDATVKDFFTTRKTESSVNLTPP